MGIATTNEAAGSFRHRLVDESAAGNGRLLRFVTTGTLRWRDGVEQSNELLGWVPIAGRFSELWFVEGLGNL